METAIDESRRSRHRLRLVVLAALLIAGLLGMHALVGGPSAAIALMTSSGHASPTSHGMTAPVSSASGAHGPMHGSAGCADAMSGGGGSACVSAPTGKTIPAIPVPVTASLPELAPAAAPAPPTQIPRRLALTHLELSIHRT